METFENAYVASVYRRTRNLKKRLQKCVDYEALQSSGKPLDAGQREALQGKAGLEQNVADMESLLAQMREIALSEGEATRGDGQPGTLSAEVVMEEARKLAEMNLAAPAGNAKKTKKSTSVGVSTTSTFSTAALDDGLTRMEEQLRSLLRVFHVACRYSASTGKDLPVELEYFRDVALGSACPVGTSFADNLANSLRQVGLYLYPEAAGEAKLITGTTYVELIDTVAKLAKEMGDTGPSSMGAKKGTKKGKTRKERRAATAASASDATLAVSGQTEAGEAASEAVNAVVAAVMGDREEASESEAAGAVPPKLKTRSKKKERAGAGEVPEKEQSESKSKAQQASDKKEKTVVEDEDNQKGLKKRQKKQKPAPGSSVNPSLLTPVLETKTVPEASPVVNPSKSAKKTAIKKKRNSEGAKADVPPASGAEPTPTAAKAAVKNERQARPKVSKAGQDGKTIEQA